MLYATHCKAVIKKSGGRITGAKLLILENLEIATIPQMPYAIAARIKQTGKKIDTVTVYRVLESLLKLGLVHKSENGFVRCFHPQCEENTHCHHLFSCKNCHLVSEIHLEDVDFLKEVSQKFQELKIDSHNFQFAGLCQNCQK